MMYEMTDHVPGLDDDQVEGIADEAAAGYDLSARASEPNPHFQRLQLPDDLLDAIEERARKDGQSPEAVVRQALAAYLHSA